MSVYTRAEQTYVDGVKYFDRTDNDRMDRELEMERARLVQKMLGDKKAGKPTQRAWGKRQIMYHCDDLEHGAYGGGHGHDHDE